MQDEQVQRSLEAWKVTIQVQQHFNDIEMKIRNYALTLLLAVVAGVGVSMRDDEPGLAISILLGGLLVWTMFWGMDELWYHRLLTGAVKHAIDIETTLQEAVPGIGLSTAIKDASPLVIGKKRHEIRSQSKIRYFYGVIAALMVAGLVVIAVIARS